jgi:hypothetical protein
MNPKFTKKPKDQQEVEDTWKLVFVMTTECFLGKPACKDCKDAGDLKKCPPAQSAEQLTRWGLWSEEEYQRRKAARAPKAVKAT